MNIQGLPEHMDEIREDVDAILMLIPDEAGLIDARFRENLIARLEKIESQRAMLGIPPWTFDQRLIFCHERYFTRALWKDKKRKSGEPYDYSHLDISGDIATQDMSITGLATQLAIMKHDDPEDHPGKFRDGTGPIRFEKVLQPAIYERLLRNPQAVDVKQLQKDVAHMVRGVTNDNIDDPDAKALRSFQTLVDSLHNHGARSVIVRLAERCHNMATLAAKPSEDQQRIAQNTLDIMVPMARLFKMRRVERRLTQDAISFRNPILKSEFEHWRDARLATELEPHRKELLEMLEPTGLVSVETEELCDFLKDIDIPVDKLTLEDLHIPETQPLYTVRILTKTRWDIHHAIGIVDRLLGSGAEGNMEYMSMPVEEGPFHRGAVVRIVNKRYGTFGIKVNDTASHHRKDRGQLANFSEDMTPDVRGNAARLKNRMSREPNLKTVVGLANRILFPRTMKVYKKDGTPMDIPVDSTALAYAVRLHGALLAGFQNARAEKRGAEPRILEPLDEIQPGEKVIVDSCIQPNERGQPGQIKLDLRHLLLTEDERTKSMLRNFFRNPGKFVHVQTKDSLGNDFQTLQGRKFVECLQSIFHIDEKVILDMLQKVQERKQRLVDKENRRAKKAHTKAVEAARKSGKFIPREPTPKEISPLNFSDHSAVFRYVCDKSEEVLDVVGYYYLMQIKRKEDAPDKREPPTIRFIVQVDLPNRPGTIEEFTGEFKKWGINKGEFNSWEDKDGLSHVRFEVNDPTGRKSMQDFMLAFLKLSLHYPQFKVTLPKIERKSSVVGSLLRKGKRALGGGEKPDAGEDKK